MSSEVFNEIKKVYAAGGKPLIKWDEDQPRDEAGRFGSGGGGAGADKPTTPLPRHLEGLPRWSDKDIDDALAGKSGRMLPEEVKHIKAEQASRVAQRVADNMAPDAAKAFLDMKAYRDENPDKPIADVIREFKAGARAKKAPV